MFRSLVPIIVALLAFVGGSTGESVAQTIRSDFPAANSRVSAMARIGGTLYIGGSFTQVGPATGCAVVVDGSTAAVNPTFPKLTGEVRAIASDGAGGWYVGGLFNTIGAIARSNLLHVDATGAITSWNPAPDGTIHTIVVHGNVVYVGGEFYRVGGQIRGGIAALDASGLATAFDPKPSSLVRAIAVRGGKVIAGGDFYAIGGQPRWYLAELDSATGALTAWNPDLDGKVRALTLHGGRLYVGGDFTRVGAVARRSLAALDATTMSVTSWNPMPGGPRVYAIAAKGPTIYIGGGFVTVGGQPRRYLAAIDSVTGGVASWAPDPNLEVVSLAVHDETVYAAGSFSLIGGQPRNSVAALETSTGLATGWNPNCSAMSHAVAVDDGNVAIGGNFTIVGGKSRDRLAAIDAATGAILDWNPGANGQVDCMLARGTTLYVGGSFGVVGGQPRNRLAALDAMTGAATSWNPGADGSVTVLAPHGSRLVAGGNFSFIGGRPRLGVAILDSASNTATLWNAAANGQVYALAIRGDTLYLGGSFTSIGGQGRVRLAAIDAVTGTVAAWNPNANWTVFELASSDSVVYVGGIFSAIGGVPRASLAALDAVTGAVKPWNPGAAPSVSAIAVYRTSILVGGSFTTIGGIPRPALAAIDAVSGLPTSWDPGLTQGISELSVADSTVYAGGTFTVIGGRPQSYLAAIDDLPIEVVVDDVQVHEADSGTIAARFTVSLTMPASDTVTVDYSTEDGSARSNGDFDAATGTLILAPGEVQKTVEVTVHGDTLREDDETFELVLTRPHGAKLLRSRGQGVIVDDDLLSGGRIRLFRATSDPGDPVGQGGTYFLEGASASFQMARAGSGGVQARATSPEHQVTVDFRTPYLEPMTVASYPDGARHPFQSPNQPGLNAVLDLRYCLGGSTSFDVREVRYDDAGRVTAFWATFEQRCDGAPPTLRGEIAYDVDIALFVSAPQYRHPVVHERVAFDVSVRDAEGDPVTLEASGLPAGATFVDHGNSTGSFEWPAASGAPDTLMVTFVARDPSGHVSTSTTEIRVHDPNFIRMDGDSASFIGQGRAYEFHEANSALVLWTSGYGAVSARGQNAIDYFHLAFAAPAPRPLTAGRFVTWPDPNPAGISISGNHRACNINDGQFDVRQIRYGPTGNVTSFWAVFEHWCEYSTPRVRGEVRFHADTALYVTPPADIFVRAGTDTTIPVIARDTRGHDVTLSVLDLPAGAVFTDDGDGGGTFRWIAVPRAQDTLTVHFVATSATGETASAPMFVHVVRDPVDVDALEHPAHLRLELDARPNPTFENILAHVTLPTIDPVDLVITDVVGRVAVRRHLGSMGVGRHTLRIEESRSLPAGIYWVQVRQGADLRRQKVVLVR